MGFLDDVTGFFQEVVSGVVNVLILPYKIIAGSISDFAQESADRIIDTVDRSGIDDFVSDMGHGALESATGFVDKTGDSLGGIVDMGTYLVYGVIGIGGIFLLTNGKQLLGMADKKFNR